MRERGGQIGHVLLEPLDDRARVAGFDLLDVGGPFLAQRSLDGASDPGVLDGHPVGVRKSLHLLDRLGRESHRNVFRQVRTGRRRTGAPGAGSGCRILVVLERLCVGISLASPSRTLRNSRLGS